MKVTIVHEGRSIPATVEDNSFHVTIEKCPLCGAVPGKVRGTGITSHDHDTYRADAVTLCCDRPIGQMRTKVDTIFGIDEDEAVCARARVYR